MNNNATLLDRSVPPKAGPLTSVFFPKFQEGTLSNGLEVWTVPNHEQPLVSLSLYVRGGSALDPRHREGLASSVAELLTKGTARRTATEIAEAIDFVGGSLSASAGWDALTINISVLSKYLDVAIDLISDVIQNSTFPDQEIERVRLQRLAGIRQARADAGFLADMVFSKLVFPSHPYGQQPIGTEKSIHEMNRDEIVRFARQYITPSNSFLTASGDINPDEFRALLEKEISSWSGPPRETVMSFGDASLSAGTQVGLINRDGAVQSALRVGHVGIRRNSPDFIALSALNMLTEHAAWRVFQFAHQS